MRAVHGDKYDYSKVDYIGSDAKICVICPTHGEFWPTANNHLRGSGCPQCVGRTVTKVHWKISRDSWEEVWLLKSGIH